MRAVMLLGVLLVAIAAACGGTIPAVDAHQVDALEDAHQVDASDALEGDGCALHVGPPRRCGDAHQVDALEDAHQVDASDAGDVDALEDAHQVDALEDAHQVDALEDAHQVDGGPLRCDDAPCPPGYECVAAAPFCRAIEDAR